MNFLGFNNLGIELEDVIDITSLPAEIEECIINDLSASVTFTHQISLLQELGRFKRVVEE